MTSEARAPVAAREPGRISLTLEKGLRVLSLFDVEHQQWTLRELREEIGESKTVVVRLVKTLEGLGFLERDPENGEYYLGSTVAKLAYASQSQDALARIAQPLMRRLSEMTGETVLLDVETEPGWPMILSVVTARFLVPMFQIGRPARPGLRSAAGKLFVAFRDETTWASFLADAANDDPRAGPDELREQLIRARHDGVAFELDNREIRAVASAVFGPDGRVRTSLSVITPIERFGPTEMRSQAACAKEIAAGLSQRLGAPSERVAFLREPS